MKVSELLDSEEKWTKGTYARSFNGDEIWVKSEFAVRWCILGAIKKCYPLREHIKLLAILGYRCGGPIAEWNDAPQRTFEDVRKLVLELDI